MFTVEEQELLLVLLEYYTESDAPIYLKSVAYDCMAKIKGGDNATT